MNPYAVFPFLSGIVFFTFGVLVYLRNIKSRLNLFYFLICFSATIWIIGYSFMYGSIEPAKALIFARIGYIGVVFIPTFLYSFIFTFLRLKRRKIIIIAIYAISLFFLLSDATDYFLNGMYTYFWGFYPKAGHLYIFYVIFFAAVFARCSWILFMHLLHKDISPIVRNQIKYVLLAFLVGMTSLVDYLQNYGIEIYPWGYISALGWIILMAVAIFKYRLMDINIFITRAGIFVIVYTLVLGIPFWFGIKTGLWVYSTVIMAIFATAGPFIYLFLQRRAESRILKEDRRIQQFLIHASSGMTTIRDLKKLLGLIIHLVSKALKAHNTSIYLFDKESNKYVLKVARFSQENTDSLSIDDSLILHLQTTKSPLILEELKNKADSENSRHLKKVLSRMKDLSASVILPTTVQDSLLGFLVLGERNLSRMYSLDLINALAVLSNQAALAIENALFWQRDEEKLVETSKEEAASALSFGAGHQFNNRLYAISMTVDGILDNVSVVYSSFNIIICYKM